MALRKNLVSHWKLEESSGSRVDSPGTAGHDLADNNSDVGNASGKFGSAAAFPASPTSSTQLTVSHADFNVGAGAFTIAFYLYLPSGTSGAYVVSKGENGGNGDDPDWAIRIVGAGGGTPSLRWDINMFDGSGYTTYTIFSSVTLSYDTWYLVVAYYDASVPTTGIAVDNSLDNISSTADGFSDDDNTIRLGAFQSPGSMSAHGRTGFDGRIDDFSFWNRRLTSTEQTSLYNSGTGREGPGFGYATNFSVQPTNTVAGATISPDPAVEILDETSTRDTNATDSILLQIDTNPGGSTLTTNTNPLAATSGVATFTGTSLNNTGTGYKLKAATQLNIEFTVGRSSTFNITSAVALVPYDIPHSPQHQAIMSM